MDTACRICSNRDRDSVHIFGDDGRRSNVQFKIRKYLYLTISSEDKLPQVICCHCRKKLDAIHRFATMAFAIQTRFRELLESTDVAAGRCSRLLHSYLLEGAVDRRRPAAESADVTEVEVRVDPTVFVQCLLEDGGESTGDGSRSNSPTAVAFARTRQRPAAFTTTSVSCSTVPSDTEITLSTPIAADDVRPYGRAPSQSDDVEVSVGARRGVAAERASPRSNEGARGRSIRPHRRSSGRATTNDGDARTSPMGRCGGGGGDDESSSERYGNVSSNGGRSHDSHDCDTKRRDVAADSPHWCTCPVCGKRISTKGNLKVHLETHRPKGKYECSICTRIFKTESNLEKHKEYHGGVRFPCGVCGRVYPTNSTLRAHSITHSDLRPHECSLCNKTFKRNQDLKFHINQHTGARPYQCLYCPKAFASSGNCFSHRKRMHPQEVERDRERVADIT